MSQHTNTIAVFIDFENLALGLKGNAKFEINYVMKRLLEKGKLVAKKAYCDWSRYHQYKVSLHEAAIELIDIPRRGQSGKNSADIRLCVDAMDLAYSKNHIETFVVVSGDSDFSPLVSKLKELGKHVIGLGMLDATSSLLRDNCDEFIYYEDIVLQQQQSRQSQSQEQLPQVISPAGNAQPETAVSKPLPEDAFRILFEGLDALRRDNREVLLSPHIKLTIKRLHPAFDEGRYGFKSWGQLLTDAERRGLVELATDPKSKCLVVVRFGDEMKLMPQQLVAATTDPMAALAPQRKAVKSEETISKETISKENKSKETTVTLDTQTPVNDDTETAATTVPATAPATVPVTLPTTTVSKATSQTRTRRSQKKTTKSPARAPRKAK